MSTPPRALPPHMRKKLAEHKKNEEEQKKNEERSIVLATTTDSISNTDSITHSSRTATPEPIPISSIDVSRTNAIVRHGTHHKQSPMELILQETINDLQARLNEAQAQLEDKTVHCENLKAENADLKSDLSSFLKAEQDSQLNDPNKNTLCGYESSEEEASSGSSPQPQISAHERIDIMAQILETQAAAQVKLEQTIASQAEQLQHLQSRIDHDKQDLHRLSEHQGTASAAAEASNLSDKIRKLERYVASAQKTSPRPDAADFQASIERKNRQEALIDNAISRQDLLQYYESLSAQLNDEYTDVASDFLGSDDELWSLRERVVRRLATFEACEKALDEAKTLMAYNGRVRSAL